LRPSENQCPPRTTRIQPFAGPSGSRRVSLVYAVDEYQSEHHSATLPCMSCKPNGLGCSYEPTRVVCRSCSPLSAPPKGRLPSKLARAEEMEPEGFLNVKGSLTSAPARQAYSHSASVGRRYFTSYFFSAARAFSFFRNSWASSHETSSTGKKLSTSFC